MGYLFSGKCVHGAFFVPHALVDSCAFRKLSPSACKLLLFLYTAMGSHSAPCIRIPSAQLEEELDMDTKTIRAARKELEFKSQIHCGRAAKVGAPYEFHLLNPETGEPFPPEHGRPAIADYKPRQSRATLTTPETADSRAVRAVRKARPSAAERQPTLGSQQPQVGTSARKMNGSEERPACPIHPKGKVYWDDSGWHCQSCEPSSYAPPADSPALKTSRTQTLAAAVRIRAASTSTAPEMTEHGLPIRF
jgi:hypothetical protein